MRQQLRQDGFTLLEAIVVIVIVIILVGLLIASQWLG